jgi:hypothetical protein
MEIHEFVYWLAETGWSNLRNALSPALLMMHCKEIHPSSRRHVLCVAKIVGLQQIRIYSYL